MRVILVPGADSTLDSRKRQENPFEAQLLPINDCPLDFRVNYLAKVTGDDMIQVNTVHPRSTKPYHAFAQDYTLVDHLAAFDRERIPERVVHAKGAGAFGYFEVRDARRGPASHLLE